MNINDVREFYILSITNSFNETAEQLFTTQSSISKHLKRLEDEIGTPLFTRTSRQVKLNDAGKIFLPYAKKLLEIQDELNNAMAEYLAPSAPALNIAVFSSISLYGVPELVATFRQENPFVNIKLSEFRADDMISLLMGGACDIAFFREGISLPNTIGKIHFYTNTIMAVMPKGHPYEIYDVIPLEKLSDIPLLIGGKNNNMYRATVSALEKTGVHPNFVYIGHSSDNILRLTQQGMGIALVMDKTSQGLPAEYFSVRPLAPEIKNKVYMIYRKDQKLPPHAGDFIKFIRSHTGPHA